MAVCTCVLKGQKRAQDPLGLEVGELPYVGAGNQTQCSGKVTYP